MSGGSIQGPIVRIVLPQAIAVANDKLRDILTREFGGYTMLPGVGSWRNPSGANDVEAIFSYEVMAHTVNAAVSVYQKTFELVRAVLAEVYDTAPDMNEQAVYITVNSTAHVLSASVIKNSTLYKPKAVAKQGVLSNAFPLSVEQYNVIKEGTVLRYYGHAEHGPYGPRVGTCVRATGVARNGLIEVEYRKEDAFEVAREDAGEILRGNFDLSSVSARKAFRFIGQGETVRQKAERERKVQALRDQADALSKPVDPTAG